MLGGLATTPVASTKEDVARCSLIDAQDSMLLVIDAQQDFYPDRRTDVDRTALADMFSLAPHGWPRWRAAWCVPVVVTEEEAAVNGATAAVIPFAALPAMRRCYPSGLLLARPSAQSGHSRVRIESDCARACTTVLACGGTSASPTRPWG